MRLNDTKVQSQNRNTGVSIAARNARPGVGARLHARVGGGGLACGAGRW